ncbi:hypothetical protein BCR43DRAFT_515411 [Syncephalastrum racemosum]|uniref:Uncharacterized protein n=1 Tax=Syncephalastrum racemosum TaxID=13706 RepID=A0A1X2H9C8_SYNRA|nr:hypothetical protein BCR43DRAFT_515411 [Syncephalastrum racemosum]
MRSTFISLLLLTLISSAFGAPAAPTARDVSPMGDQDMEPQSAEILDRRQLSLPGLDLGKILGGGGGGGGALALQYFHYDTLFDRLLQ